MDAMTFLREHVSLFSGVDDENMIALSRSSELANYKAGQTILFKGTTVEGLHVVVNGEVGVYVKATNKAMVRVSELGSCEVFGEMSIVEMGTAGATIKAETDTLVLMIPQEAFRHVLQQDEAFAVRVNMLITSRRSAPTSVPA